MSFFRELERRNVFRVGAAYVVAAWLLIQVAETIFPLFGYGDTPARIVVVVLAIGLVPVLVLAWVFELTPEGIKRDKDVDRSQPISRRAGKRLDRMIIVVLALAIAYFAFDKFVLDPRRDAEMSESAARAAVEKAREEARLDMFSDKSVAVLPFTNRSELTEDEFFTDGMHDELLTRLSRISELSVISRTSVMKFRGTDKTIREIAEELSVANVVEGSVQRAGGQVRINVQLIDAQTDEHIWAEIYDRELTAENLFAIQSEISASIAESLHATLSADEKARVFALPTSNLEAYNHFLRGRQAMALRTEEGLSRARAEFEQAVALDPDFALAWVGLGDAVRLLFEWGVLGRFEYLELHRPAVERALELDDELGEAYVSLSRYYGAIGEDDKQRAAMLKGIELNPNYAQAYHWYANTLVGTERQEKRLPLLYKAAQLDPLSPSIQLSIAAELFALGRPEEGMKAARAVMQAYPDFAPTYMFLAGIEADNGRLAEAARLKGKAVQLDPGSGLSFESAADSFISMGDFERAWRVVAEIDEQLGEDNESGKRIRWNLLVAESRPREAIALLDALPREWRESHHVKRSYVYAWALARDFDKARDLLLALDPAITDPARTGGDFDDFCITHCLCAGVLIAAGHTELGQAWLDYSIESIQPGDDNGKDLMQCHLVDGKHDRALDLLEQAMGSLHFLQEWSRLDPLPWWDPVKDNPRYIELTDRLESLLAEQRAIFEEIEAADVSVQ